MNILRRLKTLIFGPDGPTCRTCQHYTGRPLWPDEAPGSQWDDVVYCPDDWCAKHDRPTTIRSTCEGHTPC